MRCPSCRSEITPDTRFCGQCGTELASAARGSAHTQTLVRPAAGLTRGALFADRYEIIEELGSGGMGKVFRTFDGKLDEEVALKLIKAEIANDDRIVERFRNEIKIARKITHKNVCRLHDLGENGHVLYLTMEYVRGEDLKSLIRRTKRLAPETAASVARQIAEGLTEAHKLGVVHRDLKPQNIMIDREGQAKIMDFGIARSGQVQGPTEKGGIVGTPEYMSPEQVDGREADRRSDIYSLGVILYEMVTGQVPFEADTPFAIAWKHKSESPKDPQMLNPQVSPDLSRIILKCLEKDRDDRYQSAAEVREEIERTSGPPASGSAPSGRARSRRDTFLGRPTAVAFFFRKAAIAAVVIVGLMAAGIAGIILAAKKRPLAASLHRDISIAVLPFVDLSPKKDYEYLCEGIPETLITALTKLKDLRVPARTSAFSFKSREQDISEIGRALNVTTVLRGSVQVIGDMIRITPQLINVEDGNYLWSESYNRKLDAVFAIQDDMAREIVKALKITLLKEEAGPLINNYTENLQAYDLYLQGRYFANQRSGEGLRRAIEYFHQAIAIDAKYAPAYVGLADCYVLIPQYTKTPNRDALSKSKEAVSKALEIDDGLAEAHATLGLIEAQQEWKWEDAEREFRRALELNPKYSAAHQWYALLLERQCRLDEGLVEIRRAVELDPLSPLLNTVLGRHFMLQDKPDQAIEQYLKTLQLNPKFALTHMRLGEAYLRAGRANEALSELQAARTMFGRDPVGIGQLGRAYALVGEKGKALEQLTNLQELSRRGSALTYDLALVCLGLGERDKSLEWLGKAVQENEVNAQYIKVDPDWDSLRSEARFKSLLKTMGLD